MNLRQWRLYEYLKLNADKWIKQEEIYQDLKHLYPGEKENTPFHDTFARRCITDDIRVINDYDVIQKTILSDRKGIKIASSAEELDLHVLGNLKALWRGIARERKKLEKAGRHMQSRIIIGGSERDFIEAFPINIQEDKKVASR